MNCPAGWITSWNQVCQGKHQQSQIRKWYHSNGRKWRRTKEPLDEGLRKLAWNSTLEKTKIMALASITSWQTERERVEAVTDFIFLGFTITADGDCSHELKRHLSLGRKAMTNLDSILKSRDIILLSKVHLVKAMVFPVVMYGHETWTIKKAEHRRISAFKVWWCWRRLLRVEGDQISPS